MQKERERVKVLADRICLAYAVARMTLDSGDMDVRSIESDDFLIIMELLVGPHKAAGVEAVRMQPEYEEAKQRLRERLREAEG